MDSAVCLRCYTPIQPQASTCHSCGTAVLSTTLSFSPARDCLPQASLVAELDELRLIIPRLYDELLQLQGEKEELLYQAAYKIYRVQQDRERHLSAEFGQAPLIPRNPQSVLQWSLFRE